MNGLDIGCMYDGDYLYERESECRNVVPVNHARMNRWRLRLARKLITGVLE